MLLADVIEPEVLYGGTTRLWDNNRTKLYPMRVHTARTALGLVQGGGGSGLSGGNHQGCEREMGFVERALITGLSTDGREQLVLDTPEVNPKFQAVKNTKYYYVIVFRDGFCQMRMGS